MIKKILSTSAIIALTTSLCLAQVETVSTPGKSLPVTSGTAEQGIPLLNSAPVAPTASISLSDIAVAPSAHQAVFTFSTNIDTHAVIEYGLTTEYDHSISTEPQSVHTETIGGLLACKKYYYRVQAEDVSTEGTFKTLGCSVAKKVVKISKVPVVSKTPKTEAAPIPTEETIPTLNAAPEKIQKIEYKVQDEKGLPETPREPMAINETSSSSTPTALILFALLSGIVVAFFAMKKKKKWYQR
ncbi:MAG: fibronectin type III domain-containing protein [bacterium]